MLCFCDKENQYLLQQILLIASKRGLPSLITLFLGGAMVNLMLDTGQITLLARHMTQWGSSVYGLLLSGLGFLAGMAFGQGIPACGDVFENCRWHLLKCCM